MNEMGWAYTMHEGKERHIQDFGGETWVKGTIWNIQAYMGE